MKFRKKLLLLFFLLMLEESLVAQTRQLKFNEVNGVNGITLGKINSIVRDIHGVMWFSDQTYRAVIRYDGSRMTKFQNDPKNPNSLGGYYPECLFADSSGKIWIGFYGMGLDRFDPETGIFTHYRHQQNDPSSLANDSVTSILVDHLGNIWVGNYSGLDLLDPQTGKFKHYSHKEEDSASLSSNKIRALYEDHQGELWIGTGLNWENNSEGGLNGFNRQTGTFTRYLNDPQNPHSLINNKVRAIFEDSRGTFWVGTAGDGLHTMDRKTGLFTRYTYDPSHPDKLSRPPLFNAEDNITFITEDAEKEIWIGSLWSGLTRYNTGTKKITHYGSVTDSSGGYKNNSSWWANTSPDGLVWISTQSTVSATLYMADLYTNYIPAYVMGKDFVDGVYRESASVMWFATDSGLVRIDTLKGTKVRYLHEPANENSLSNNVNNVFVRDQEGFFWLGTAVGLNRFDPKTRTVKRFLHSATDRESLSENGISNIYEDSESNLWIGTWGGGLNKLDRKTGKFTSWQNNPADTFSISENLVTALLEDDSKDLWVGTVNNGGLNRLNIQTGKFTHYLQGLTVITALRDAGGIIWVGTTTGLFRYDRKSNVFNTLEESNPGLAITDIRSMKCDNENNLWIGTTAGIYRLNKQRDQAIFFGKSNGVSGEMLSYWQPVYGPEGEIIFGNFKGYYTIHPDKIKINSRPPVIYFTNFWLDGQPVKPGNGPLKDPVYKASQVSLSHDQNVFSISFSVIKYGNNIDKVIFYKLENYDKEWRTSDVDNKVFYYNIPPGKYNFRIKTVNSDNGIWAEKNIAVIISPPWWATWWAYSLYALLFIGLAFTLHRVQKARVIKAERERTREKELAQAKEIEKAYQVLKTTQSQLIQQEKMASLGELTAGIAHEIQNPLNFVNNFSEVSTELIDEMNSEIEKGNVGEVKNISGHIKQNLEKIMHHGKRADAIVKGMLQHSQAGAGQKELVDINVLADEYFRLAYHGLRAKDKSFNAGMKTDYDKNIGLINVVPQDIGRVIINLITNAFYAVTERQKRSGVDYSPVVMVTTKKSVNKVFVSVRDNGNGIPQRVLDKIFQPFFTTKPAGQGTGLGLSLSYDIIKAHGGELKVETKEGEYTDFVVSLPATS